MDKGLKWESGKTKTYVHHEFGYVVTTNLTSDDITKFFPEDLERKAFFVRVGDPEVGRIPAETHVFIEPKVNVAVRSSGEEWLDKAACKEAALIYGAEFTPAMEAKGPGTIWPSVMRNPTVIADQITAAMEICSSCPVAKECFTKSIEDHLANRFGESGVWAGAIECHRASHIRMRNKKSIDDFRQKMEPNEAGTNKICTRCLRPAIGSIHSSAAHDRSCPGPVTSLLARDIAVAIFAPKETAA